jgi:hypothetical protein
LAEGLGLSQDDLTARLQAGETLGSIAEAQGLSDDQLQTLWESAWQDAVDSAVANGTLTQAQADWILQHVGSAGAALGCPMMGGDWACGWGRGMGRGFFDRPGTP